MPSATPSGFFALRTPLLPWRDFVEWTGTPLAPSVAAEDLDHALAVDRAALRARLRELVRRPEVIEAIFLASPSLHESVPIWIRDPDGERGAKAERALVRYFARMAGRSTPFGLFAGCSTGTIGATTRLTLAPRGEYRRHTRLDMDYVGELVDALAADPAIRRAAIVRPNTSLYRAAGRLRYAEARSDVERGRSYHLIAVEPNPVLDRVLETASQGARAADLAAWLASTDPEIAIDEATEFIDELIASQILVPDLAPPITGPEAIHSLLRDLAGTQPASTLERTRDAIAAVDAAGVGADPEQYKAIATALGALPAPAALPRLFQVDMIKPCDATLGTAIVDDVVRVVELLARIAPDVDPLARFREAFVRRYETREVRLTEALDNEIGIGLADAGPAIEEGSPLLAGLAFSIDDPTRQLRPRDEVLIRLAERARRIGATSVELDDETIRALAPLVPASLPDSLAALASIVAGDPAAIDRGAYQLHVSGAHGASGARLLGRFCHADAALCDHVRADLAAEEARRPDAIFAEIVHLPEGRMGNVLQRPLLRAWELPYVGRSGAPVDRCISVDDLRVSVLADRVVLRSARHGREVIPRITSAHNLGLARNLILYRFLGLVMDQGVRPLSWNWGAAASLSFLPRVTRGRAILALARWLLDAREIAAVARARDATEVWRAVQALRAARRLPRFVCLVDGDNDLPIDLDNALCVDTFAHAIKTRSSAVLAEQLATACIDGPEGRFDHELVVPLRATTPTAARALPTPATPSPRRFAPGSEWLYAKLYGGVAGADRALRQAIGPLVRAHADRLRAWFFVRYADPDDHLRVRFRGDPSWLAAVLLPALHDACAPLIDDGSLWRIQLDTYEREVERYGGPDGIEAVERIFWADSEAAIEIVDSLSGDRGADARWRLALVGVDRLLQDFALDLDARKRLAARARDAYRIELRSDKLLERRIGERFRRERMELERMFDDDDGDELAPFRARSARVAPIAAELRAAKLTAPLEDVILGVIHMQCDRLLRDSLRAHELVIYDFLHRIYEGRLARARR